MPVFDATDAYVSWPKSKFSEPRPVPQGIQLKKSLSAMTENWWSQRWFGIIDEFGLGVRWERAKLYVARGQVVSIEIENGLVKASVQGSDDEPYRVMISVKTIPKAIWAAILHDLGKTSAFAIGLSSGTLPAEEQIGQVFQANGVLLFPDRQGELHTKCTCLDWSNPCKHIAAVYLLLGAEFDRDPFLLFKLRGLEQSELFKLSSTNGIGASALDPAGATEFGAGATTIGTDRGFDAAEIQFELTDQEQPESSIEIQLSERECFKQFWRSSLDPSQLHTAWSLHSQVASLPASLGEFPFWQGSEDFLDRIRCAYEMAPAHAKTVLIKRNNVF